MRSARTSRSALPTVRPSRRLVVWGRNLVVVPKRMIVQAWRGTPWSDDDLDSVLVLTFETCASGARVKLVQAMVPDAGDTES